MLADDLVNLRWDGDVDVVVKAEDPGGRVVTVVVEAKVRASQYDVCRWAQRMQSVGFRQQLEQLGYAAPDVVYLYAMRPDAGAKQTAAQISIGLLKSKGEVVSHMGEIN